jgi:hypothetical protein
MYVAYVLNHCWNDNIKNVPLTALLGVTVDTSILLRYHFWQQVYFKAIEPGFPSDSKERLGHVVGISEHVGHAFTWKILDSVTHKVIHRSLCRPINDESLNRRLHKNTSKDTSVRPIIQSKTFDCADVEDDKKRKHLDVETITVVEKEKCEENALLSIKDLVGRTFLKDCAEGQRHRAGIVDLIDKHDNELMSNPERAKFLCALDEDGREELLTYNQRMDYLNRDIENSVLWRFNRIISHQGPLGQHDRDSKRSKYNITVEWEGGEVTTEPLNIIAKDDPVTCAVYERDNNLLNLEGWKRFKSLARRQNLMRLAKQAYLRSFRTAPKFKYGHEVPKNFHEAKRIDTINANNRWHDAISLELMQIDKYNTFADLGHSNEITAPKG